MPIGFNLDDLRSTKVFVETGFLRGDGVKQALTAGFERVYSIELRGSSCKLGAELFKKEIAEGKVTIVQGNSEEVLEGIIKEIDEPITFFLDAHLGLPHMEDLKKAGVSFKVTCPLAAELDQIGQHHIKNHVIIIDDVDQIVNKKDNHEWTHKVNWLQTVDKVKQLNEDYQISYHMTNPHKIARAVMMIASTTPSKVPVVSEAEFNKMLKR